MSRIRLLSETVASQVAAGEVIERPASVVKELVENSIDAGARKIDILIRRGGISYIRVIDDGSGMDRDDALLSLERHATSKIRSVSDLEAVGTLGFRGEALPSIASVSRFRLTTREPNAIAGTEILVNGGKIDIVRDGGEAPGTQVEVRSLFYNVPARRKFLRSENTETRNIEHQLHLQAIGHANVAFSFGRDDRVVFQLPATATLTDRIRDLYGNDLLAQLLRLNDADSSQIKISGLVGQAGLSRQTRSQQLVFVNGRAIESPVITAAIREGYHTALMKGQYAVTFLFLELDPGSVDVNVHPAKREVRFRDPNGVREAIVRAIHGTLAGGRADWQEKFRAPVAEPGGARAVVSQNDKGGSPPCELPELEREFALRGHPSVEITTRSEIARQAQNASPARALPEQSVEMAGGTPGLQPKRQQQFQIIGVLNKLYVLMENADGLVLVDQHAAHERILFEELRRRMEEQGVPSQKLLISQTFELPPRDADWIEQNMSILQKMGIGIESFGPNTFKIDSLPGFLNVTDGAQFMRKVIDDLKSASDRSSPLRLGEDMIASTVCRHAVKANDPLRYLEVEKLIQDLLDCDLPYCCPHGRPTMIQISNAELEKNLAAKFNRMEPRSINILGTPVARVNYASAFEIVQDLARESRPTAVCPANTHILAEARHDPEFARVMTKFDLVLPDGMPVVWAMNMRGAGLSDRVYGPYFMKYVLEKTPRPWRHFFFGDTDEVLEAVKRAALQVQPNIDIVGAISPPFRAWNESDEAQFAATINAAAPDFVWVALAGGRMEQWIAGNQSRYHRGVFLAVGDALTLLSGRRRFAPKWMQRLGLTWLFRMLAEPRRLGPRYLRYNSLFVYYLLRDAVLGPPRVEPDQGV